MGQNTLPQLTCSGAAQAALDSKVAGLEQEAERLRLEEGGRKKEAEEYQTHLEEELAESQAQRAALLEEGASNATRMEVPAHISFRDSLLAAFCTSPRFDWSRLVRFHPGVAARRGRGDFDGQWWAGGQNMWGGGVTVGQGLSVDGWSVGQEHERETEALRAAHDAAKVLPPSHSSSAYPSPSPSPSLSPSPSPSPPPSPSPSHSHYQYHQHYHYHSH